MNRSSLLVTSLVFTLTSISWMTTGLYSMEYALTEFKNQQTFQSDLYINSQQDYYTKTITFTRERQVTKYNPQDIDPDAILNNLKSNFHPDWQEKQLQEAIQYYAQTNPEISNQLLLAKQAYAIRALKYDEFRKLPSGSTLRSINVYSAPEAPGISGEAYQVIVQVSDANGNILTAQSFRRPMTCWEIIEAKFCNRDPLSLQEKQLFFKTLKRTRDAAKRHSL